MSLVSTSPLACLTLSSPPDVQGGSVYSCKLCARAFSSHTVLLYHYRTLHQLQRWDPSTWDGTAASPASPVGPEMAPGPEIPDTEPADPGTDVHFILTTETVKGRAFDYGRMVLKCLHCVQKYYSKEGLVGHVRAVLPGTKCLPLPQLALQGMERVMSVADHETYVKSVGCRSGSQKHQSGRPLERPHGKKFVCPVCKKGFTRKRILQLHTSTHQAGCSPFCGTQRTASPRRLHQCQQCSFQSAVSAVAWLHRQEHRQGTVTCGVCHCAYLDRSTLNKHMRVHDAERPCRCSFPHCGWRFKAHTAGRLGNRAQFTPTQESRLRASEIQDPPATLAAVLA
ncbi:zinc finger protein 672 isoform X3 [Chelonia mydas]|uniref:zinc finger protein 672 isoform X3 n=1 Tax=Chelonia mydas TaxID=8469 RepID=UPI0018A1CA7C|nr:zinc finger protein 672 isoform X3 [Chelonia mydas]